ncbi:MAG TPA: DUF1631 family protein [Ramlibacter sp.]|uniref:DUF1631 family protein n=1 Tax=Ramlibacter sp. TaxID=1917967 RepID=UPI002D7E4822|nr:DUF1631 family protein [Ramlibacter sp.]HET8746581.1 DUF1631 family protein [Ramlibacter sp.]
MSVVNQTVSRSMGEAVGAAARLIEKCVDHAVAALQQMESGTSGEQRQQVADAWRALIAQRRAWTQRFPRVLGAAFEAEASGRPRPAAAPRGDELSLALVDDGEISRSIETARLAQLLTATLERPLSELDALMSSALGLRVVQPERNPLRPVVYARALREMMAEGQPDPAWPPLWLRHMATPLAQELEQVYKAQTHFLTLQRVSAANYRLRAASEGPSSRAGSLGGPSRPAPLGGLSRPAPLEGLSRPAPLGGLSRPAPLEGLSRPAPLGGSSRSAPLGPSSRGAPLGHAGSGAVPLDPFRASGFSGFADLPVRNVEGARLQQFLLRGEPQAHRPLAPSYYAEVDAELRALEADADDAEAYDEQAVREHLHLPPVDRPARAVDVDSPLPEHWGRFATPRQRALVRGRLKTQAREVGQVYGLEVVRRLVNRVAGDPRLLAPLREAIVGLEPSLLRLAMVAPRFFSDADHPGRLLVEKVAERSFRYNDEFSVEFQGFFGPVARSFQRLNEIEPLENADPFRAALTDLQATWAAQDALDDEPQRRVLDAVQFADRRQHEADRIASEFLQRSDLQGVDTAVREFVLGPWSLVVAHARLAQPGGGIDPGGFIGVLSDLLWSVKRELTLKEPARAFELIPRVLMKLRAGLAMLGQHPAESEAFFLQLERLHRPVMKLRARQRHRDVAPPEPFTATQPAVPERAPGEPWMAQQELHAAGFEEAPPSGPAPLAPRAASAEEGATLSDEETEALLALLAPGSWVDLHVRGQWRRAHLKWAAERRTLFLFVSHGGQPHSMTRRTLHRLVKQRLVRLVDSQAVVPRALAQLAEPAAA